MTNINRNGRNGILTSWNSEAVEYFKTLHNLYSQFKDRIYLEESDKVLLLSCYKGKAEQRTNRDKYIILRNFIQRQFILMGYPKGYEYIKVINGVIVLDFGKNEERINRQAYNEYHNIITDLKGGILANGESI